MADEEEHNEGDDDIELNYDDIEDDDESMGDRSSYINDGVNDVGQPTSTPGEGMGNEHPEEHSMSEEHEEDDHNPTDPDVGADENPGVVDQENEGVEQECQAVSINEKKEKMSTEIDTGEDVMTGQDSEEEHAVQGTPRYNLRKQRARSYKHVYDPEVYVTEKEQQNETGDVIDTIPTENG